MKSEIILCQIKDSKNSRNRFIFYPNKSCISPYNTTINNLNYNIIKQKRKNEQKHHNINNLDEKSDNLNKAFDNLNKTSDNINKTSDNLNNLNNLNKKSGNLGTYNFNYNSKSYPEFMENNFSKKYKNICNNNINNENINIINLDNKNKIDKDNKMIEIPMNEGYFNNKFISNDNYFINTDSIPEKDINNVDNNFHKNKKYLFPKGNGGAKAPNKKIGKKK